MLIRTLGASPVHAQGLKSYFEASSTEVAQRGDKQDDDSNAKHRGQKYDKENSACGIEHC